MFNFIIGQYDSENYPLKRYFIKDIKKEILTILYSLNKKRKIIFRGGISFIMLANELNYQLKDIDALILRHNVGFVIELFKEATKIYLNKNTFGLDVITIFWIDGDNYYKIDILIVDKLPEISKIEFLSNEIYSVSAYFLLRDRLIKIAEKNKRNHNDKKTLNHYNVSIKLTKLLLEKKYDINSEDIEKIKNILKDIEITLEKILLKKELKEFLKLLNCLILKKNWSLNEGT